MEADRCNPAKRMRRNTRLDKLVPFILSLLMPILACAPAAVAARHAAEGKVPAARASGAKENLRTDSKAQSPAQPFSVKGLKDTEGLVLKQEYRFIGKCTTYFSPLGISVESNSLSILFNAKTQNLCVYSDDTKKYYACDPETWKKKSKVMFQNPNLHPRLSAWKFLRNEKICGMDTMVYSRFSYLIAQTNVDTIWVTHDIRLTPDARSLLFALLKVADSVPPGVPLRHSLSSKHAAVVDKKPDFLGRHRVRKGKDSDYVDYETYSIQKIRIPARKYTMPSGYKRAESEMEVFFSAEDSMGDLDVPDFASEKGKNMLQKKFK